MSDFEDCQIINKMSELEDCKIIDFVLRIFVLV